MNREKIMDDILRDKIMENKIEVPENIKALVKNTIDNLPKKSKKKKIIKRTIITAATIVIAFSLFSATFPAVAKNIPIVNSVFSFLIENNSISDSSYIDYSDDIKLSQTSNGVTVVIDSIVYDTMKIAIGYTVKSDKKIEVEPHILDKTFKIDGKVVSFGSGGTGEFIDEYTYVGMDEFSVGKKSFPKSIKASILGGEVDIPDTFNMDLNIRELLGEVKGEWDFRFKVTNEKVKGKVKNIPLNLNLSKIDKDINVKEVITTPINTVIRTSMKNTTEYVDTLSYIVMDDKGKYLQINGASGNGGINTFHNEEYFSKVNDNTASLTFIPYIRRSNEAIKSGSRKFKEEKLNNKGETIISFGKLGGVTVESVDFLEDKTLVRHKSTGNLSSMYETHLVLVDSNGKEYESTKITEDNDIIIREFPKLNPNESYKIKIADYESEIKLMEDSSFTVNIK
ncbi:DUF4179 domain-containing protein [Clostridium hydrogeniformans]|uniref:DUF4179 domain-containing protein n=1 Tax=Clostridium hydrogeniformans TaxID=349933 RepID=UPI00047FEE35|nr:DUF4179 domain-containing protein [Clostridium hydrogeniformans]